MQEPRRKPEVQVGVTVESIQTVGKITTGWGGIFNQWNNVSISSGLTNTYGPFDISTYEKKSIGIWVNTGNVSVTILVSNNGTNFKPYYTAVVNSGESLTASFTETFASMRVDILGLTEAGYTLMISRQV